jgi:alanine racemase
MFSFLKREYKPLNRIEVSSAALHHNYTYLSKSSGLAIAPVLKSNAYGHGLGLVAKALDDVKAPFFCVDSIYEGYELLKHGIKTPILIMGYVDPQNLQGKRLPFSFAVSTKESLLAIAQYQSHAGIHIFVDTGINREGFSMKELASIMVLLQNMPHLHVEGLMGHFAASDKYTNPVTDQQIKNFQKAQELFSKARIPLKWIHHANSSGVLNYAKYKDKIGNVARTGIALYGIDPENKNKDLKPALTFKTKLGQIKQIGKGEPVGYDFTFITAKPMTIGILPAGYNDGLERRLSNKGLVTIRGKVCPIIGLVSMNITVIDISSVKDPKVGEDVVIYANAVSAQNTFWRMAKVCETIPYTMLVQLRGATKRILV